MPSDKESLAGRRLRESCSSVLQAALRY